MAKTNDGRAASKFYGAVSNSRLLNEREAAGVLGLKVATLRRWRWAGKGPCFLKIGSAVRYDPPELAAFIEAARRSSTSDRGAGQCVENESALVDLSASPRSKAV